MNSSRFAFECIICYGEYNSTNRRPCIGTCGHSICEICKHQMNNAKCPQCNREDAFAITTINYQILDVMKCIHSSNIAGSSNEQTSGKSEISDDVCSGCGSHSKKLRICIDCGVTSGILKRAEKGAISLVIEGSQENAFNGARKFAICSDCVLEHHRTHDTKMFSDLKDELNCMIQDSIVQRIQDLYNDAQIQSKKLNKKLNEYQKQSLKLAEKFNTLKQEDRKPHTANLALVIQSYSNVIETIHDTNYRIDQNLEDVNKQIQHIEETGKVLSKKAIVFANSDPVLIADRKQNVKDPLLIGVFNPREKTWLSVGRMPNPKSNYAVATYQTTIYIVGGMFNGAWLSSLEMYDRDKNLRRDCLPMANGRTRTSAAFHNGKLYVCGGYDGHYMNSVEVFDPETKEWKVGPDLQRPRADCAIVSCSGVLYILGGYNGKEYEEKIEILDESLNAFVVHGEMNGSRAGFGACVHGERIYVAGGWSNANNTLKDCRSYDPMTRKWRDETAMNRDRKYFQLHATQEAVYAIRGCADNWSLIAEVERYNVKDKTWEIIPCVAQLSNTNSNSNTNPNANPNAVSSN